MKRFRVRLVSYVEANDEHEAAKRFNGIGRDTTIESIESVSPGDKPDAARARQLAAIGMDRWRDNGKLGLTPVTAFEVLELMKLYFLEANSRGKA